MTPHVVYRCYDRDGLLLYIGCTSDVVARMAAHMASAHNPASRVLILRMARYELEEHPDRESAQAAERAAIYAEAPLANLHHQRAHETPTERERRLEQYLRATRPVLDPALRERMRDVLASFAGRT